jgi:hypothetical protein
VLAGLVTEPKYDGGAECAYGWKQHDKVALVAHMNVRRPKLTASLPKLKVADRNISQAIRPALNPHAAPDRAGVRRHRPRQAEPV